jgi:hypothetical protein
VSDPTAPTAGFDGPPKTLTAAEYAALPASALRRLAYSAHALCAGRLYTDAAAADLADLEARVVKSETPPPFLKT